MGFWDKEPDEAAVREAMRRLKKEKDEERDAATAAAVLAVTGGLGLWLAVHAAVFCVLLAMLGGAAAQWLKIGVFGGLALGLVPAVAWWKWEFRRRRPVLAAAAGFLGAVLGAWVLLQLSAR